MSDAGRHFSNLMDKLRFGRPEKLHEILGLKDAFKYQDLVNLIPCDQLLSVNPKPIGKGTRGEVYKAVWRRPQTT
jgi:hypothetical protein